jgi:hypothetical protein
MSLEIKRRLTHIERELESSRDENDNIMISQEEAQKALHGYLLHFFNIQTANKDFYLPRLEVEALLSIIGEQNREEKFNLTERVEKLLEKVRRT